jgi:N-acetylglucosaminyldiphosphoundecaprenol N-acetyl-beta-D-mannosaminyltransferase
VGRIFKKGFFMNCAYLFGLKIAAGTEEDIYSYVRGLFKKGGRVATVNPVMLSRAIQDNSIMEILREFELKIPDGIGVVRAIKKRGIDCDALPGVEMGRMLLSEGGVRLFLVGGKAGVCDLAAERLKKEYSHIDIVGVESGYGIDSTLIKEKILKATPNLVYVCLGTPKQEILINELYKSYQSALYVGLGGSIDIYSGKKKRVPVMIRKCGFEWLFRILADPRRLGQFYEIFYFVKSEEKERKKLQKTTAPKQ